MKTSNRFVLGLGAAGLERLDSAPSPYPICAPGSGLEVITSSAQTANCRSGFIPRWLTATKSSRRKAALARCEIPGLVAGLLVGSLTTLVSAAETRLALDPALWEARKNSGADIPATTGGVLTTTPDSLRVASWLTGTTSPRFEYRQRLPVTPGTVLGRFRTAGLLPRQARVRLQFFQADRSLVSRDYALGTADAWTDFALPIIRPPTGADAVSVAFGLAEKTAGRVEFADLRVSDHYDPPSFAAGPPTLTRPAPPPRLAPAPRVRLASAHGAWWLVDPAGRPFFSTGSAGAAGRRGELLAPVAEQVRQLGFNSLGGSHDLKGWAAYNDAQLAAGRPCLFQFRILESRVGSGYDTLVDATGANPGTPQALAAQKGGFNHAFPDPFDPRWRAAIETRMRETLAVVRDQPYFAGWFADNEREHRDLHRYVWSPPCAAALRRFLEARHATIAALNTAWGSRYASFDDLIAKKPDPVVRASAMFEDFRLFSREILREFNATVLRTIRAADPGRLVLSNRFMIGEIADVLENLDLYRDFDVIAVNIYPANLEAGLNRAERQFLEEVHRRSGRPILIGEWSVPALDSGLYANPARLDWSYPQAVDTQAQRARQAAQIQADLYNLPFVVGAHWFIWRDIDSPARQANRGLFRADGRPWPELTQALAELNHRLPQL